jgi:hypothetical protein
VSTEGMWAKMMAFVDTMVVSTKVGYGHFRTSHTGEK